MVIIALILILVTCINLWYHDLAVIFIWTWLYIVLCIDVPAQNLKFLIYTHWFYPPQGEQRQSLPPLFWFASVGFIIHCLHPSTTFQFCFNPTYHLTCGMEDLSVLEPLLDKPPCLYCVSALSWRQNLPLVSWIVCLNHSGWLSQCLALCRTPLGHLRCCWLKLKAHVLLILEMFVYAHGK